MAVVAERDLGDEDDVGAARDAAVERDPAGEPPHHLDHHHAPVALGRRVQPVDGHRHAVDGGGEPEGEDGAADVVVDRLGHADDGDPVPVHLLGDRERAVTADDHQGVEAERLHALARGVEQLRRAGRRSAPYPVLAEKRPRLAVPRIVPPRMSSPASAWESSASVCRGSSSPSKPLTMPTASQPAPVRRLGDGPDDGIQPGAVPAPGHDPDALVHAAPRPRMTGELLPNWGRGNRK